MDGGLPLDGIRVVELGTRIAAGAAGSLLAQLGADVVLVEPPLPSCQAGKWQARALVAAGKRSLVAAPDDAVLRKTIATADVLLTSSDLDPAWPEFTTAIHCDMTAFGSSGPLAGHPLSDASIQAMAGITETTGAAGGPPLAVGTPVLELSAALYATAAVLAALRQTGRPPQRIEVALFDCAVNALTTFLPAHFGGKVPSRIGNWHPLLGPWNAYRAADGWLLICTASEPQWQRLCHVIEQPELLEDERYRTSAERLSRRSEIDAAIERWTTARVIDDVIAKVGAAGIPCGPILRVAEVAREPNLAHRGMVLERPDPETGASLRLAGSPFRSTAWRGRAPDRIPPRGADRSSLEAETPVPRKPAPDATPRTPLAGLRVVEIGQYTTAPLAARHLALLGAEVIRVEPPGGEPARSWNPGQHGMSWFFPLANSGKRAVALDLSTEAGKQALAALLSGADVLVENLKPGALAKLGFDRRRLTSLNKRLVYCAISGFGADSVYPERPAFDTVIQAMGGLMDLTRDDRNIPYKAGISIADICGGQFALVAILAAIAHRDRTGDGQFIDMSMQDAAAWSTQLAWNGAQPADSPSAPALGIADVVAHPQTIARDLIYTARDTAGHLWPLLAPAFRFSVTPVVRLMPAEPLLEWATIADPWHRRAAE